MDAKFEKGERAMKISKCEGCLNRLDELHGICPHYDSLGVKLQNIGLIFCYMRGKYSLPSTEEQCNSVPQEWVNYDFPCKFYSSKPTTEGAFL